MILQALQVQLLLQVVNLIALMGVNGGLAVGHLWHVIDIVDERTMCVCVLLNEGEIIVHERRTIAPLAFLNHL